jgi:hypothetical protein
MKAEEYRKRLLDVFLDTYEKRKRYLDQENPAAKRKRIKEKPEKLFPEYADTFESDYRQIDLAIEELIREGIVSGEKSMRGSYPEVSFRTEEVAKAYRMAGRQPREEIADSYQKLFRRYLEAAGTDGVTDSTKAAGGEGGEVRSVLLAYGKEQLSRLSEGKKLDFGLDGKPEKLELVLRALAAMETLTTETYIRNFSIAVFKNSKVFQDIEETVIRILKEFGEAVCEQEDSLLEYYHLYQNPGYVSLKGQGEIEFNRGETIRLCEIPGGIALPTAALSEIRSVRLTAQKLLTVENLTTYHDTESQDAMVIYLGGFHNTIRKKLICLIAEQNPKAEFWHYGDLDPYGFLILSDLRDKTGVDFRPWKMGLEELMRYEQNGYSKPLTKEDVKLLESERLSPYREILDYMKAHNCKAEQEAEAAWKLTMSRGKRGDGIHE